MYEVRFDSIAQIKILCIKKINNSAAQHKAQCLNDVGAVLKSIINKSINQLINNINTNIMTTHPFSKLTTLLFRIE